jgi:hypothetical protein
MFLKFMKERTRKGWLGETMSRSRHRACLQDGLKLDLNSLAREGFIKFGACIGARRIVWSNSHWGEIGRGQITADMTNPNYAWFRIEIGVFRQDIKLISRPRHFGGRQWFFQCPATNRLATVLWRPPGAYRFCSRQAWGGQVAYRSQFLDRDNRAHAGKERIKGRLIGDLDPDEWELPPKPKWMRWETYNKYEEKFDRYEKILDHGCAELVAKMIGWKIF